MIRIMLERLLSGIDVRVVSFHRGGAIFRQGDASDAVFQVRSGRVAMIRILEDGSEVTMAHAGPGESFAEAALFAETYHCDAIARIACEVSVISAAQVRQRLASDPALALEFAAFLSRQVRSLRARVELLRIKRAPVRVLAWLRQRAHGATLSIEQADAWAHIATEIGLSPEALYRALRVLERAGRIERQGRDRVELVLDDARYGAP